MRQLVPFAALFLLFHGGCDGAEDAPGLASVRDAASETGSFGQDAVGDAAAPPHDAARQPDASQQVPMDGAITGEDAEVSAPDDASALLDAGADAELIAHADASMDGAAPTSPQLPTQCSTVMGGEASNTGTRRASDVTYDAQGNAHYWFVSGVGAIPYHFTLDVAANTWRGSRAGSTLYTKHLSVSSLANSGRVATVDDQGTGEVFDHAEGADPVAALSAGAVGDVLDLRSGITATGYRLYALVNAASGLVLRRLDPSAPTSLDTTQVSATPAAAGALAFGPDDSVDVVWSDAQGQLWGYNTQRAGVRSLSSSAGVVGALNLVANGAANDPSVLFAAATEWRLWRAGQLARVRGGRPGPGKPAIVKDGAWLFGAVYDASGDVSQAEIVRLDDPRFGALITIPRGEQASLAARPNGQLDVVVWKANVPSQQQIRNLVEFLECK